MPDHAEHLKSIAPKKLKNKCRRRAHYIELYLHLNMGHQRHESSPSTRLKQIFEERLGLSGGRSASVLSADKWSKSPPSILPHSSFVLLFFRLCSPLPRNFLFWRKQISRLDLFNRRRQVYESRPESIVSDRSRNNSSVSPLPPPGSGRWKDRQMNSWQL